MLLKEYLSSGDVQEALRCVRDLEVPHFHHELVYEVNFNLCKLVNLTFFGNGTIVLLLNRYRLSLWLWKPSTVR